MRRAIAFFVLVPLLVTGCGDRSLILTVDVLSFLDPADVSSDYGPIPGGIPSTTVDLATQEANLLPGIQDATEISSATLQIGASFDNQTGTANAHFLVYVTPGDSADVFSAPPIADIPVSVTPGTLTNVSTEVTSTALAEALVHEKAKIGVRATFDTTPSGATPVQGTETITLLRATVITKKKL
ncbi:MAG: hypothetical protein ACM3JJ_05870 [Hyphomicrobiales bacterium]